MPYFKSRIVGFVHIHESVAEDWTEVPSHVAIQSRFRLPTTPFTSREALSADSFYVNSNRLSQELQKLYDEQIHALKLAG